MPWRGPLLRATLGALLFSARRTTIAPTQRAIGNRLVHRTLIQEFYSCLHERVGPSRPGA
jgi:hypothetical protein